MTERKETQSGRGFPKLPAPALRARNGAGYVRLEQLTEVTESGLLELHGMGPTAVRTLREALTASGLSFASEDRR